MTDVSLRSDMTVELVDGMGDDASVVRAMLVSTQGSDAIEAEASFGRINFHGRDALRDAFEEAVDLATYLAQVLIERDGRL